MVEKDIMQEIDSGVRYNVPLEGMGVVRRG